MNAIVFNEIDGVEYDPLYNEILLALSDHDNSADPLINSEESESVDWVDICEKCERLLTACKDLRVMIWHLRATLHTQGIIALFHDIRRIDEALASGETVFPHMPDEPEGSSHAAALGWMATASCLSEIKQARLMADSTLTIEELQRCMLQDDSVLTWSELIVILGKSAVRYQAQGCPALQFQCSFVVEALARIEQYANQHSDSYQLDCRNLRAVLSKMAAQLAGLEQPPVDDAGVVTEVPDENSTLRRDGQIRSRQDAVLMMNSIIDYFKAHEPSHPAPIFIRRAQKLIGMEFEDIVEELMPDARGALGTFIGKSG
ncbi:ImpA family type VI secretion system protein [Cedecea sp.]|jgi:type VI secretion system protein ImpA|uniref:type VI secretion system protein TssA n=1 Tax=Cedecea sp. TaxID=1970739 RepID=UPI0012AE5541|nr:type VI secretion protein TssA [Enterobacteriaceae bacterium RIT693]